MQWDLNTYFPDAHYRQALEEAGYQLEDIDGDVELRTDGGYGDLHSGKRTSTVYYWVDPDTGASLERLGRLEGQKESFDADDYVTMMGEIRAIAGETGFSTADVGYALFAYDVDTREGTLH